MLRIIVKEGKGGIERALKEYKSKVIKTRQLKQLNERKTFKKKSVIKRDMIKKAIYVNKKFKQED